MVGSSMYPCFKEKGYEVLATDKDVNETWLSFLDVRELDKVREAVEAFNPDVIIHLAALTSLEYCEENLEDSFKTNYLATKNLAEIAKERNIPIVYTCTAGIFDGKSKEYEDESYPNPINIYGRTKLFGELAVRHIAPKHFIIRPGWMFGGGKKDKKFVSYILSQMQSGAKSFKVVNDTFGTPTYTYDLARNIEALINTDKYGVYNMVCKGKTNRIEIAKEIIRLLNMKDAKIEPVSSDFFKEKFSVPRAQSECLLNKNLDAKGLNLMSDWSKALEHYIQKDWNHLIIN